MSVFQQNKRGLLGFTFVSPKLKRGICEVVYAYFSITGDVILVEVIRYIGLGVVKNAGLRIVRDTELV